MEEEVKHEYTLSEKELAEFMKKFGLKGEITGMGTESAWGEEEGKKIKTLHVYTREKINLKY